MSTESNWCAGVRALIANTRARLSRPGSSLQDEYENLQHIGPAPGMAFVIRVCFDHWMPSLKPVALRYKNDERKSV